MTFVDTHAHLEAVDDLNGVLNRAKNIGVGKIVTIGTSIETSKREVKIAEEFSNKDLKIYATCGIHPKDGKGKVEKLGLYRCIDTLKQIVISSKKVVGVGEAGLDYYPVTTDSEKNFQRDLFETQIKLAVELNLPLVIHCRNAWNEIFGSISKFKVQSSKLTGVFHSWTGDWQTAKRALDLGFYISFSGIVTFKQSLRSSASPAGLKNAPKIQDVAKKCLLRRCLLRLTRHIFL